MKNLQLLLLFLGLIANTFSSYSQNLTDCDQLLKKEISIQDLNENGEEFLSNIKMLIDCEFEEIDFEIFMGNFGSLPMMMGPMFAITEGSNGHSEYTFQDLKKSLESLKNEPEYLENRNFIETRKLIFDREAYISNWESDVKLIEQLDASEELQVNIHSIVKINEGKKYSEIFKMYSDTLVAKSLKEQAELEKMSAEYIADNPGTELLVKGLYAYETYEDGLRKSKDTHKPTLLYFNGYACVNARKMDEFILSQPDVQNYINKHFVLVNLMVDDRQSLEESEMFYSEILNRDIKTVGQKNLELQTQKFQANAQPLFVIVGIDGKEVSRIGYVTDVSKFNDFLKSK